MTVLEISLLNRANHFQAIQLKGRTFIFQTSETSYKKLITSYLSL
jgi:hypothetical protein